MIGIGTVHVGHSTNLSVLYADGLNVSSLIYASSAQADLVIVYVQSGRYTQSL